MISIIIPTYNDAQYLPDALGSIKAQTHRGYEIIMVVDGGDDRAETFRNQIDLFIRHRANLGLSMARNTGIEAARGEFIVPLDADDKLHPHFLEQMLRAVSPRERVFAYCHAQHFGLDNGLITALPFDPQTLRDYNYIVATTLFPRRMWEEVRSRNSLGYDPELQKYGGWEDWLFYQEAVALGYTGVLVDQPLFYYRMKRDSMHLRALANQGLIRAYILAKMRRLYGLDKAADR